MSIIYSYPEQGALNANDLLIGTSAEKVGGKQKNITRNFSIQQIADFINRGAGFVDPVASDFQIPVFNQEGKKITGSIMSQDSSPSNGAAGSAITIAGSLVTTGDLTSPGVVTIGGGTNLITLNSETYLKGSLRDSANVLGADKQILLSDQFGYTTWTNYEAGLTYEGTWDANANTTNGLSNSPALLQGVGVSGHFYIVNVEGTTSLGPGLNDWHVGDWAIFLDEGGQPASWQKIDNTSTLVGSGTAGTFAKWTNATTLNDSIMSESGTVVSVDGDLKVKDTVEATTTNSNLKLKGNGTGGVEIMSADGVTDGKITLNCSQNSHGVTLQSPPHASGATYTLVLPTNFGGAGDVLTSAGANPSQLVWTTPTTGTVTGTGTENYVTKWSAGGTGIENSTIFDNGTNVGIGTASPVSRLHVKSTANSTTASFSNDVQLSGEYSGIDIESSHGAYGSSIRNINTASTPGYLQPRLGFFTQDTNTYLAADRTEKLSILTSGNVGIGTTSPADKLHVEGNIYLGASSRTIYTGGSGNLAFQNNTGNMLFLRNNGGSESMRITSSGNVGIGKTNPAHKLSVFGGSIQTDSIVYTNVIRDHSGGNVSIQDNGGNVGIGTTSPEAALHARQESATILVQDTRTGFATTEAYIKFSGSVVGGNFRTDIEQSIGIKDNSLVFARAGSENMRIDSSGNVGIGTTSPAVSLDISATDAVQMPVGITNDRPLTGVSNGMLRYNSTNNEFEGYINGNWGSIGGGAAGGLIFRGTFDASTGAIASGGSLYTCPAGGSGGTVDTAIGDLYIVTTAGSFFCSGTSLNVGDEVICITAATATNDNVNNWNAIASGAGGAVTGSGTTNYVPKFTGATVVGNSSIIDSSGKVGIGDIPSFKLDVNVTSSRARFKAASGDASIELSSIAGHDWLIQSKSDSSLAVYDEDEASERMRIDSSGNVGIGTTSPDSLLQVGANLASDGVAYISDYNPSFATNFFYRNQTAAQSTVPMMLVRQTNTGDDQPVLVLDQDGTGDILQAFTDTSQVVTIDNSGNVGIGTSTPSTKLQISATMTSSPTSNIFLDVDGNNVQGGGGSIVFGTSASAGTTNQYNAKITGTRSDSNGSSDLSFFTTDQQSSINSALRMIIKDSGNVGIGTDSPEVSLDLGNNTDAIQLPAGDNTARAAISNPFGGMIRYNTTDDQFEGYSGVGAAGSWGALGGGGASATITSNQTTTSNATTTVFLLGATPNGNSVNFVDVFIDGVYQETTTYSVSGASFDEITFNSPVPSGVTVETKTTADYNVGAAVDTVSLGQSNTTGNVDLRIVPLEVTSGQTISGNANSLYIFTATGAQSIATVTLPGSPTLGDSIKISNLGGLANVLGANGNKIMGVAADLTINTPTAAFEIIWSGSNNGWIIIGNV